MKKTIGLFLLLATMSYGSSGKATTATAGVPVLLYKATSDNFVDGMKVINPNAAVNVSIYFNNQLLTLIPIAANRTIPNVLGSSITHIQNNDSITVSSDISGVTVEIYYSQYPVPVSGGASWGGIGGTLTAQTDLVTALLNDTTGIGTKIKGDTIGYGTNFANWNTAYGWGNWASGIYAWAKAPTKPTYTYTEVGADASGAAAAITLAGLGGVPTSRQVAGHPLTGDVTVSKSDVSLGNCDNTSDANKPISSATQTALDGKLGTSGTAADVNVSGTNIAAALSAKEATANKGAASGYAPLDANSKVPLANHVVGTAQYQFLVTGASPFTPVWSTAYPNLVSIGGLANASGWLNNNGSGTFVYSTPTYTQVGAQQSNTNLTSIAALANGNGNLRNNGSGTFVYNDSATKGPNGTAQYQVYVTGASPYTPAYTASPAIHVTAPGYSDSATNITTTLKQKNNYSTTSQSPTAATRTYIAGSAITTTAGKFQIGTQFRWTFDATKTAAGTATSTIDIAFGTTGTTSDVARVSFTKPAGTAAIDCGKFVIDCIVRGPISSSCIAVGHMTMTHNLAATGHAIIPIVDVTTVSSTFDITTPTNVGVCITTGASDAITIQLVEAESLNLP